MKQSEKRLDELGIVGRGRSRHRPRDAEHLYGGKYPFIQTGDVKHSNLYITQYSQTYSEAGLAQSKLWKAGTLCITIAANIAETGILGIDACFPDSIIGFTPDPEKANVKFIKYLFDALLKKRYKLFTQGAAQDNLSQSKLLSIKFPVPDIKTQNKIADILSKYDDLIENNRRRIELLEESARLLYREWFVHLRFPGHEHSPIIDGIPEGWEKVSVPEIIEINPKETIEKEKEVWYIPMSALSETGMTLNMSEFERRNRHTTTKFRNSDVLFARITPCLENGKTAFVNCLAEDEIACGSTEFMILRGKKVSPYFTYCLSRDRDFRENAIKSMIGSSGRQRVQKSCFNEFYLGLPSQVLMSQFNEFASACFTQIQNLIEQNQKLSQARDLLLPRLMNGEITV
ncbi:restriction modification system DNA specificity domain protein [Halothece sp. PCC 7418]|uniref:restriction endonuclease subunit S n=1 Tax=Halothece sp. (strain PCC 7418) TaxID=65093 RepID=UPI0002A08722|nr:restriction endonuclease subunit S [Halothece sp. PCC 7418]AFZ43616.1 restriction modification system DNA specificity domain protein [Halothece sp. PCC 7418]